ncbi:ROK family protein [Rhizobium leguminosarum]|uniref:ROK family protein n=1 Tax=Rhizobium leguminosarum TaxID=384 RepID=UPI0012BC7983|nr:ROK family protein [Rhizobium leguminosarum]
MPVVAVNDVRHGARSDPLVFMTVSTGLGGGIVSKGRLRRGRNFPEAGGNAWRSATIVPTACHRDGNLWQTNEQLRSGRDNGCKGVDRHHWAGRENPWLNAFRPKASPSPYGQAGEWNVLTITVLPRSPEPSKACLFPRPNTE